MLPGSEQGSSVAVTVVTSAYNEADNLEAFHQLWLEQLAQLQDRFLDCPPALRWLIVDNASQDRSAAVIRSIMARDQRVQGYRNSCNYGPEPSFCQALKLALEQADIIVLMCSDLQDPPAVAASMLAEMLEYGDDLDSVLACKQKSSGSPLIQFLRRYYYQLLRFSDRNSSVPPGYHGFGCYTRPVVEDALDLWEQTSMNLRACLAQAAGRSRSVPYRQTDRLAGRSSYNFGGYVAEAVQAIFAGQSIASRLTMRFGLFIFLLSILLAGFIVFNKIGGRSGYAGGVPTLALLILCSSAVQVTMLSLVSRQIEQGINRPQRPRVRTQPLRP